MSQGDGKGGKQDRKMESRMRTAGCWQNSRDILPLRFSLSLCGVIQKKSKEKFRVDVTQ